jgi:hypothetical protein
MGLQGLRHLEGVEKIMQFNWEEVRRRLCTLFAVAYVDIIVHDGYNYILHRYYYTDTDGRQRNMLQPVMWSECDFEELLKQDEEELRHKGQQTYEGRKGCPEPIATKMTDSAAQLLMSRTKITSM